MPRESSAPPPPDDRPYDNKLMRLAEILGAVHYLRELCGAQEGQIWRDQMKEILRNEGTTAVRRAKLVNSFNDGYRGYRRTYRSCTQSATLATIRFSSEGASDRRLARARLDLRQQGAGATRRQDRKERRPRPHRPMPAPASDQTGHAPATRPIQTRKRPWRPGPNASEAGASRCSRPATTGAGPRAAKPPTDRSKLSIKINR